MKRFKNLRSGNELIVEDEATIKLMAESDTYEEVKPKTNSKKPKDEPTEPTEPTE